MNVYRKSLIITGIVTFAFLAFPILLRGVIKNQYSNQIHDLGDAPKRKVGIVLGAAVLRNGRLSSVLRDRMDTAIELYNQGRIDKIIASGDRRDDGYDEPGAMLEYAILRGVPKNDLEADYGGKRTYDSCYRARYMFQVDSAIIITQNFHLPRALFTCEGLGLEVDGVAADRRPYRAARWYEFREIAATTVALIDIIGRRDPTVAIAQKM